MPKTSSNLKTKTSKKSTVTDVTLRYLQNELIEQILHGYPKTEKTG